jgi:hypothetical protein
MEDEIDGLAKFAYFEPGGAGCVVEVLQLFLSMPVFLAKHAIRYPPA